MKSMFISLALLMGVAGAAHASHQQQAQVQNRPTGVQDGIYGVTNQQQDPSQTAVVFVGQSGTQVAQQTQQSYYPATQMMVVTGPRARRVVFRHLHLAVATPHGLVISSREFSFSVLGGLSSLLHGIFGGIFGEPRADVQSEPISSVLSLCELSDSEECLTLE